MALHGSAWLCMVLHDSAWHCLALHDSVWHCLALLVSVGVVVTWHMLGSGRDQPSCLLERQVQLTHLNVSKALGARQLGRQENTNSLSVHFPEGNRSTRKNQHKGSDWHTASSELGSEHAIGQSSNWVWRSLCIPLNL